jgi:hypothetical protein
MLGKKDVIGGENTDGSFNRLGLKFGFEASLALSSLEIFFISPFSCPI